MFWGWATTGDYNCDDPPKFPSLMTCARESDAYPAQEKDKADYRAIYEPNRVIERVSRPFAANVYAGRELGVVEFNFDARKVVVEESIELRRWNSNTWQLLHAFPADTGQIRFIARNQPMGLQRYRFFSTTQAQIKGQCYENDSDCDPYNNDTSATPIGFATDEITLTVKTDEPDIRAYILDLTIVGRGTVQQTPDLPTYGGAELVTLVAAPSVDIYKVDTNDDGNYDISEEATLSQFTGWTGDDAVWECGQNIHEYPILRCPVVMWSNMSITATFATIHHQLTISLDDAPGASSYPRKGLHTYTAGTLVRVRASWNASTHHFGSWNGCIQVLGTVCLVYMNEAKTVGLALNDGPAPVPIIPVPNIPVPGDPPDIDCPAGQELHNGRCRPEMPATVVQDKRVSQTTEYQWRLFAAGVPGAHPPNPAGTCYWELYQRERFALAEFETTWMWDNDDRRWVGTTVRIGLETDYMYDDWTSSGMRRELDCGQTGDGASGARSASLPAPPAAGSLPPGDYVLAWDGAWYRLAIPNGAQVRLRERTVSERLAMVFSIESGAEIVVVPSRIASDPPETDHPTLSAIVRSIRPENDPAQLPARAANRSCAEAPARDAQGALSLDLDTQWCAVVRGGGTVTVSLGTDELALTLSAAHSWLVLAAPQSGSIEATGIWIVERQSRSHLILDPATGGELSRRVAEGATEVPALFDALSSDDSGTDDDG